MNSFIKNNFKELLLSILSLSFFGCNPVNSVGEEGEVLARIGKKTYTTLQLKAELPEGIGSDDSVKYAQTLIANWVKERLWVAKAKEQLTEEVADIDREVEAYRNSLFTYHYQQRLIEQRLDKTISENEMQNFYTANQELFLLDYPIIKGVYIQLLKEVANKEKLKKWVCSDEQQDLLELEGYCFRFAKKYDNFEEGWGALPTITAQMRGEIAAQLNKSVKTGFYESTDSVYYRCLLIKEIKQKNQKAPLNFVRDRIENLILNSRKLALLKKIEFELHQEARNSGLLIRYN